MLRAWTLLAVLGMVSSQAFGAADFPVCAAAGDQEYLEMIPDGAGGAILVWLDHRNGNCDIYAQRIDADGQSLWAPDGVAVCAAGDDQRLPKLTSDGAGGAIVVWYDMRSIYALIYAQRLDPDGNALWTTDGVAVSTSSAIQVFAELVPDGAGGAIVTWRHGNPDAYDVRAQRLDADGNRLWSTYGYSICSASNEQTYPKILSDGAGGAFIAWQDDRNGDGCRDAYAQRVDSSGTRLWASNGVPICTAAGTQTCLRLTPDDAGGFIMCWEDGRAGTDDDDVYAQRVDGNGNVLWQADGKIVCSDTGEQGGGELIPDGAGGALIAWQDGRPGTFDADVYAQRIDANGDALWAPNGVAICTMDNMQFSVEATSDQQGGMIVTWVHYADPSNFDVYAQRIDGDGNVLWTPNGEIVCDAVGYQVDPRIAPSGPGRAVIAWEDTRGSDYDIYGAVAMSQSPTWLMMYYMCNGGNLEPGIIQKFAKVAQSSLNANYRAYMLWDHVDDADPDRVYRMKYEPNCSGYTLGVDCWSATDIGLPELEMDTGDVNTVQTFVDFVLARESADHVGLVVFNHGGGTHPSKSGGQPELPVAMTGICFDDERTSYLTIEELGQACGHLATAVGGKFDVLHLDACLMQMIEVNYEVRDHCDYVVACENEGWCMLRTSWEGGYLDDISTGTTGLTLANSIAEAYFTALSASSIDDPNIWDPNDPNAPLDPNAFVAGTTVSVLDQAHTGAVAAALDALATTLIDNFDDVCYSVRDARNEAQKLAYFDHCHTMTPSNIFVDLRDLCEEIIDHVSSAPNVPGLVVADVVANANALIDAIGDVGDSLVTWEAHTDGYSCAEYGFFPTDRYEFGAGTYGVSIFFPQSRLDHLDKPTYYNYVNDPNAPTPANLAFVADTHWDEFLEVFLSSTLTVWIDGEGTVTIDPDQWDYPPGTEVTLTADPVGDYEFEKWRLYDPNHYDDGNYIISDTNNPITIVMNGPRLVAAKFEQPCGFGGGLCGEGALPTLPLAFSIMGVYAMVRRRR